MSRRIAVMQPYFYPYAGYFRLFAAADEFVLLDDVQFPRRGRVHRCEIQARDGAMRWLTLPLARQPRDTRIDRLEFAHAARARFDAQLDAAGLPAASAEPLAQAVQSHLSGPLADVVGFLEAGLRAVASGLGLERPVLRSSSLSLPPDLRGEERILAICRARGASDYLNPSGGRALYSAERFAREGIALHFLDEYAGPYRCLLPALLRGESAGIAADVRRTSTIEGRDANR